MVFVVIVAALLRGVLVMTPLVYLLIILFTVSGVSMASVGKGYVMVLPFIVLQSVAIYYFSGQAKAVAMFLRVTISVLAMLYVVLSTDLYVLMKALGALKFPLKFVSMFMLAYRSIFLFKEETEHMRTARRARGFKQGTSLLNRRTISTISATIGMLFFRVDRRAGAIHTAMRARNFKGEVRTLTEFKVKAADVTAFVLILLIPLILLLTDWGLFPWKYFV